MKNEMEKSDDVGTNGGMAGWRGKFIHFNDSTKSTYVVSAISVLCLSSIAILFVMLPQLSLFPHMCPHLLCLKDPLQCSLESAKIDHCSSVNCSLIAASNTSHRYLFSAGVR